MKRYGAEFPMIYGDMAVRHYSTFTAAKREVTKHVRSCQSPERVYGCVYIYEKGKKVILYEYEN